MKIPLWLIALLLVGYTIWCANFWHSYQVRHCCGDDAALAAGAQSSGVPLFKWNTDKPVEDANFAAWKKSLLANLAGAPPAAARLAGGIFPDGGHRLRPGYLYPGLQRSVDDVLLLIQRTIILSQLG